MTRRGPFLNVDQAARYVGYEPGRDARGRKQRRAFYRFLRRRRVEPIHDGRRLLFREADLDQALSDKDEEPTLADMATLARAHARGGLHTTH